MQSPARVEAAVSSRFEIRARGRGGAPVRITRIFLCTFTASYLSAQSLERLRSARRPLDFSSPCLVVSTLRGLRIQNRETKGTE